MTDITPTTTTWSLNAQEVIYQAYRKLGFISSGNAMTPDQLNQGIINLNLLLKDWEMLGMNLWRQVTITVNVSAGAGVQGNPIQVQPIVTNMTAAYWQITPPPQLYTRPMNILAYDEYWQLPNKQLATSQPSNIMFDRNNTLADNPEYSNFYLYPTLSAPGVLYITVQRSVLDVLAGNYILDIPIWAQQALVWNLAAMLANDEGAAEMSPATVQTITAMAQAEMQKMLDFDRPAFVDIRPARLRGAAGRIYR